MQNWVNKKAAGEANVIAAAICNIIMILIFYFMVSAMLDYSKVMEVKNEIYTVCDRYLEQMMADGCLTDTNKNALCDALSKMGATEIQLDHTTLLPGEYGDRIALSVVFRVEVKVHAITDIFSTNIQNGQVTTSYYREAVSYH